MSLILTILGSSSAIPTSKRFPAAHLLQADGRFYLIDCGEGTQIQLRRLKKKFGRINHIFISHLHGDHVFGLFGLVSTLSLMGRKTDLHLFAPPQIEAILENHFETFAQEKLFKIIYHPLTGSKPRQILDDGKVTVDALPLKHSTPCFGFLFREKEKLRNIRKELISFYGIPVKEILNIKKGADYVNDQGQVIKNELLTYPVAKGASYAYCTDTLMIPKLKDLLQDVDLFYHEATFLQKDLSLAKKTLHSTAAQAAEIAAGAGVQNLLLGHFSVRYKQLNPFLEEAVPIFANVRLACDGDEYTLEQGKTMTVHSLFNQDNQEVNHEVPEI